jgi:hypothetical protein
VEAADCSEELAFFPQLSDANTKAHLLRRAWPACSTSVQVRLRTLTIAPRGAYGTPAFSRASRRNIVRNRAGRQEGRKQSPAVLPANVWCILYTLRAGEAAVIVQLRKIDGPCRRRPYRARATGPYWRSGWSEERGFSRKKKRQGRWEKRFVRAALLPMQPPRSARWPLQGERRDR